MRTDYIIAGGLHGAIVAREGITRSRVKLPLNSVAELSLEAFTPAVHSLEERTA